MSYLDLHWSLSLDGVPFCVFFSLQFFGIRYVHNQSTLSLNVSFGNIIFYLHSSLNGVQFGVLFALFWKYNMYTCILHSHKMVCHLVCFLAIFGYMIGSNELYTLFCMVCLLFHLDWIGWCANCCAFFICECYYRQYSSHRKNLHQLLCTPVGSHQEPMGVMFRRAWIHDKSHQTI